MKRYLERIALATLVLALIGGCAGVQPQGEPAPEPEPQSQVVEDQAVTDPEQLEPGLEADAQPEVPPKPEYPPAVTAGFNQAIETMQGGAYAEAIPVLEALVQDYPELTGLHINLGLAYLHEGDDEKARKSLLTALSLRPDDPVALNQLAVLQRRAGRFNAARELYEQALEAAPDYAGAHLNLGILCDLFLLQSSCALAHYTRYIELSGGQSKLVQRWIADLERRVGKLDVD